MRLGRQFKCCLSDTFYNLKNNYSVLLPNLSFFVLVHDSSRPPRNQALYSHGTEDTYHVIASDPVTLELFL